MPEIIKLKNGDYHILVLATIYTEEDAIAVGKLKEELSKVGTEIVLFPADNEYTEGVNMAVNDYKVPCANWQGFLTRLRFRHKFQSNHLSVDDMHMHTNFVGGFAGACLLYARLFGETPNADGLRLTLLNNYSEFLPGDTDEEKEKAINTIIDEALDYIKAFDENYK